MVRHFNTKMGLKQYEGGRLNSSDSGHEVVAESCKGVNEISSNFLTVSGTFTFQERVLSMKLVTFRFNQHPACFMYVCRIMV